MTTELHFLSIAELGAAYRRRSLSPAEVTAAHLRRIGALDPVLLSYITVTGDLAVAMARESEERFRRGASRGPLDGIPVGLKDLFDTVGVPTTAASLAFADRVPGADATVVRRVKDAGAVLLGKHTMNEFASGRPDVGDRFPPPCNPWDVSMASGGSSSGSAVALAAGLCAGAFGSDTGGSIRLPASNCGVVGLKPTNGVVSLHGVVPLSWSLDVAGPLARTVEDVALLLEAVAGHDADDPRSARVEAVDLRAGLEAGIRGVRIGAPVRFAEAYPGIDPEALAAYRAALAALRGLGAAVETIELPPEVEHAKTVFPTILLPEALAYHRPIVRSTPERYGRRFRARLLDGATVSATDYALALRARTRLTDLLDGVMRSVDLIALPTVPWPHAARDDNSPVAADRALLTFLFNLSGQPAISVPAGFTKAGLPLGLQLAARRFEEPLLLRAAHAYERAAGWYARHPAVRVA